jgi:hypothetical protein
MLKLRKNTIGWISAAVFFAGALLLSFRFWMLSRMPEDRVQIPDSEIEKQPEIPPRPGILGIEISGPVIKAKKFEIDFSRSGQEGLNWKQLIAVDRNAQIIVSGSVNDQGRLVFSERDVRMEGHPQAGVMIERAMRTWVYTPFKSGTLEFTFNLPSEGKKLIINASGLRRKSEIPEEIPILNGPLYSIEGIPLQEVQQISGNE